MWKTIFGANDKRKHLKVEINNPYVSMNQIRYASLFACCAYFAGLSAHVVFPSSSLENYMSRRSTFSMRRLASLACEAATDSASESNGVDGAAAIAA